jgi:hypothetical protein
MLRSGTFYFLFLFLGCHGLLSKDLPKTYDAPVKLTKSEVKKLEKANELIKSGVDLWIELNQKYNPESITNYKIDSAYNKDACPILFEAAKKLEEGITIKYDIYHGNNIAFWKQHHYDSPSGLENAKRYQKEAGNYIEKAQLNRRVAENYKNEYVKAYDRYFEALSLEIIAVKKEGRALQIFQDWPVHYAYQFDDDIEVDLFNPKKVVAAVVKKEEPKPVEKVVENKPVVAAEAFDSTVIYYQVQIAAHTQQLTPKDIKDIYVGAIKVQEIREEGWYKYTLGRFQTFEEANKLLKAINVPKAFVVAYKNWKRVPIKEASGEPRPKSQNLAKKKG